MTQAMGIGGAHLRRFDLNLLVALNALLHFRNVTRAGEYVGLSHAAMSGELRRLRRLFVDELGRAARGLASQVGAWHAQLGCLKAGATMHV